MYRVPFTCHYELDQRPDVGLANLFQESYRLIQSCLGPKTDLKIDSDGLPDPPKYVLLYNAALVHGAADASLTLTLHNLGREARLMGRQIFEYWVRASYYVNNPDEAKALLLSTPFTEKQILDELGYDKTAERYTNLEKDCDYVLNHFPGFTVYREPSLRRLVGPENDANGKKLYAFFYRIPSQTGHATGAGLGTIMRAEGIAFDSQEPNPNISLYFDTWIVLQFLTLMNSYLKLGIDASVDGLKGRMEAIHIRLGKDFDAPV